jgi:hypothetical protein
MYNDLKTWLRPRNQNGEIELDLKWKFGKVLLGSVKRPEILCRKTSLSGRTYVYLAVAEG